MKKLLKSLFCLLMFFGLVCVVVGCKETKPTTGQTEPTESTVPASTDIDVVELLADEGKGVYTVSKAEGKLTAAVAKTEAGAYSSLVADLSGKDLTIYQSLSLYIGGDAPVVVRLQGTNADGAVLKVQVSLKLTSTQRSVEWDLSDDATKAVLACSDVKLTITAWEGYAFGTGSLVMSNVVLREEEALYNIVETGLNENTTVAEYDGVSQDFGVNMDWYSNDYGVYTVGSVGDAGTTPWKVTWNKVDGQAWSFLRKDVKGDFGNFRKLKFGVTVEEGMRYTVKVEGDGVAKQVECTGTGSYDDTNVIDLSDLTVEQRDKIKMIMIFVNWENDKANSTGEQALEIHWMSFQDYLYRGQGAAEYKGGPDSPNLAENWNDSGDGVYTISKSSEVNKEGQTYIAYNKGEFGWASAKLIILNGGLTGNFSKVEGGLNVPDGKKVLIKVVGEGWSSETEVTGIGAYNGFALDITKGKLDGTNDIVDITVKQRNTIKEILIFAEPDTQNAEGGIEIHWMGFSGYLNQLGNVLHCDGNVDTFSVNKYFKGMDLDAEGNSKYYTFTEHEDGSQTVAYDKSDTYQFAKTDLSGDYTKFTTFSWDIDFGDAKEILLKIEGANGYYEWRITSDKAVGSINLAEVGLTAEKLEGLKYVLFVLDSGNLGATKGTVKINKLEFSK